MINNKFKSRRTLWFILPFLIIHSAFYIAHATVRYVSHEGSNTPPYLTWETAADSIMSAINISVFGDTIYVANGVYKERIDMIPGLTLVGAGMDSTIIDTREFQLTSPFFSVRVTDSCYFSMFQIITYDQDHGFGIRVAGEDGVIEFNKIKSATLGIDVFTAGFNSVRNNIITEINDGIKCFFTNSLIAENIIYPGEDGLVSQINSAPTYYNNIVILNNAANISAGFEDAFDFQSILKNNLFYSLDNSGHNGMDSYEDSLINNIVLGEWDRGIFTADSNIRNNHIEKAQTGVFYDVGSGLSEPDLQYNNLWQNQTNFQNFSADTTNLSVDPMFVNDTLDFHLQMYSPLIDAGDPNILDIDGSRSDIGLWGGLFGEIYTYQDLAPRPPRNLTAEYDSTNIEVRWNRNTEPDFNHYNLFRDTTANFNLDSTTFIISLTDTFYQHIIPPGSDAFYYKLTAADNQGNESGPSEELTVLLTSVENEHNKVTDYRLYQNFPNPFNPSTVIAYKLKERSYVKLMVYDIKGELIKVLVNRTQDEGYYEVKFNSETAGKLSSGLYIYQMMVRNERNIPVFTQIKKMLLVK